MLDSSGADHTSCTRIYPPSSVDVLVSIPPILEIRDSHHMNIKRHDKSGIHRIPAVPISHVPVLQSPPQICVENRKHTNPNLKSQ